MTGWRYEVWICDDGWTNPADHDGSCGLWKRAGIHWNQTWFKAFEEASTHSHAVVEAIPVQINPGWKRHTVFEYHRGGGLCKGCWNRHINTHSHHERSEPRERCQPCIDAQKRRGPLTLTPFGRQFMCEECRASFRNMHERQNRDPDRRLYRTVLDVAREDAWEGYE